ncbi:LOW QUALITY PROTEIN: phospholipase A1-II 5-like [Asparagus officinalis]|uniref:LOW QUALITY PROTEIN: phospholipase A1-II 5-like n=1 Tax=Asparagus officinalis TaxID=4686 RepID=UPI00098E78D6|nr:LOW QUALITY PROTEIN: phospholipase A1-II 5-like [Asparagus officinalis]
MTAQAPPSFPSWAELLGSDKWANLLNPLDLSLRRLILRCGDFCQVTYDAFHRVPHSSRLLRCQRYGKRNLLPKSNFPFAEEYSVADFLYATSDLGLPIAFLFSLSRESWSMESNWIGYIAVSSDSAAVANGRREIYVVWRGTIRDLEWADVIKPELVSIQPILSTEDEKVMKGWFTMYTSSDAKSPFNKLSARDQLLSRVKTLVELYSGENLSIVCVGHSLGASLAILSAFDIVESGLSKISNGKNHFPVAAIVFGSPQVGNKAFNDKLENLPNLSVLHVKNKIDLIPLYPSGLLGYVYTGTELVVDARKSPFLKDSKNSSDWHNLQGILHAVAGWTGEKGEFELKVKRSVGLVNKSSEYLKDELLIPGSWWVEKNKGMVIKEDGDWELAELDEDDLPAPPDSSTYVPSDGDLKLKPGVDSSSSISATGKRGSSKSGLFCKCFGGV